MDIDAFVTDLKAALALLPRDMVKTVLGALLNPAALVPLMAAWPKLRELMEPHIKAAMVAYPAGMLDMAELQTAIQPIIADLFAGE